MFADVWVYGFVSNCVTSNLAAVECEKLIRRFPMPAAAVIVLSSTLVSRVWRARHRAREFYLLLPTR